MISAKTMSELVLIFIEGINRISGETMYEKKRNKNLGSKIQGRWQIEGLRALMEISGETMYAKKRS